MRLTGFILFAFWMVVAVRFDSLVVPLAYAHSPVDPDRRLIGEYEATDAVAISEDLLAANYHGSTLIRAILSAKAQVWILTRPKSDITPLRKALQAAGVSPRELEGVRFISLAHGGLWVRDFGPQFVLEKRVSGADTSTLVLVDPSYRDPADPSSDLVPQALGRVLNTPTIPLPFDLDGGNLLATNQMCLTSHMAGSSSVPPQFKEALKGVGCKAVLDLGDAPHAHVDMWVKIIAPDLALVHELNEQTLSVATRYYGGVPKDLAELKIVLDQKAQELSRHMQVKRLPLPLPFRNVFRSYANALLVNGTAIVPRYESFGWTRDHYPDHSLKGAYESRVAKVYKEAGFRVVWVKGDELIFNGGGLRCASLQIPRLDSIISLRKGSQGGRTL